MFRRKQVPAYNQQTPPFPIFSIASITLLPQVMLLFFYFRCFLYSPPPQPPNHSYFILSTLSPKLLEAPSNFFSAVAASCLLLLLTPLLLYLHSFCFAKSWGELMQIYTGRSMHAVICTFITLRPASKPAVLWCFKAEQTWYDTRSWIIICIISSLLPIKLIDSILYSLYICAF